MSLAISYSPNPRAHRTREYVTAAGLLATDLPSIQPSAGTEPTYAPIATPGAMAEDFLNFRQRVIGVPILDHDGREISYPKDLPAQVLPANSNEMATFYHATFARPSVKVVNSVLDERYRILERISKQTIARQQRRRLVALVVPLSDGRQTHVLAVSMLPGDPRSGRHILVDPQTGAEYTGLVLVLAHTTSVRAAIGATGDAVQVGFYADKRCPEAQALSRLARNIPAADRDVRYACTVVTDGEVYAAVARDHAGAAGWACAAPHRRVHEGLANVPAPRELLAYACWRAMQDGGMLPPDPYRAAGASGSA